MRNTLNNKFVVDVKQSNKIALVYTNPSACPHCLAYSMDNYLRKLKSREMDIFCLCLWCPRSCPMERAGRSVRPLLLNSCETSGWELLCQCDTIKQNNSYMLISTLHVTLLTLRCEWATNWLSCATRVWHELPSNINSTTKWKPSVWVIHGML